MREYDWIEDRREKRKKKEEFKEKMQSSTEYIDWLEKFTKEYKCFATDSFLYEEDIISEDEKNKIYLLEALYEAIVEFADKNYINPKKEDCDIYYNIKHNGIGYEIGYSFGQGSSFYCLREEPKEEAIDYKQLMNNEKLPSTIIIDEKLQTLEDLLNKLVEEEIPKEAIKSVTNKTLKKIKNKKEDL